MLSQHFEGNYKNSGTNNYSSDGDAKDMKYCISQGYDGVTKWNNGTYACTRFDPSNNGECYWCKNDNDGEYYPKNQNDCDSYTAHKCEDFRKSNGLGGNKGKTYHLNHLIKHGIRGQLGSYIKSNREFCKLQWTTYGNGAGQTRDRLQAKFNCNANTNGDDIWIVDVPKSHDLILTKDNKEDIVL